MRILWRSLTVVATVATACAALGSLRIDFAAQVDGRRLAGAEVCFYPAGDDRSPADLHLFSRGVRCVPADSVVEMPAGRWLYYMQHSDGYVSSHPSVLTASAGHADAFREFPEQMRAAAILDFSRIQRHDGEWFAAYVSNEGTSSPPTILPIVEGESTLLAPAGMTVVPLRVRRGEIIATADPVQLRSGESRQVAFATANRQLVAWTVMAPEARRPGSHWETLSAPSVRLSTPSGVHEPIVPLRSGFGSDGALLLFRDVAVGTWELVLDGDRWAPAAKRGVNTGSEAETVVNAGVLETHPVASLLVRWTDTRRTIALAPDCAKAKEVEAKAISSVRLMRCPGLQRGGEVGHLRPADCTLASTGTLDELHRVGRFDAVEPGLYVLVLVIDPFPAQLLPVELVTGQREERDVQLRSFDVYGRVTIDNAPALVRLEFASGAATSDASGHYYASLHSDPRDLPIRVVDCATNVLVQTHVPEFRIEPNRPYDIALFQNEIRVEVVDEVTNLPIENATVNCGVLSDPRTGAGTFLEAIEPTDSRGQTTVAYVPADREIVVCASATAYARACAPPITVKRGDRQKVTVKIAPTARRGRVVVPQAVQWGWVYFVTAAGVTTERIPLTPDGTFTMKSAHAAPEYAVVVSNLPLAIIPLELRSDSDLQMLWPAGRVRTVNLSISEQNAQSDALVALHIGGRYVPNQAWVDHQMGRSLQAEIYGRGPLQVRDVVESGPIDVTLGPRPEDPVLRSLGADLFILPQFRSHFQTKRVTPSDTVVFD
jgi:hypothetical protein